MSRVKVLHNTAWNLGRMLVSLGLGLVTLRLYSDSLRAAGGPEFFGLFFLLLAISGLTGVVSMGQATAMVRSLSLDLDKAERQKIYSSGVVVTLGLALVRAIILIALSWSLVDWFDVKSEWRRATQLSLCLFAVLGFLSALGLPWSARVRAEENYPLEYLRAFLTQLLQFGCAFALPVQGSETLLWAVLAWMGPQSLTYLGAAFFGRRQDESFSWSGVEKASCLSMARLAAWTGLRGLGNSLFVKVDQILINLVLGPLANAYYGVTNQLRVRLNNVSSMVSRVLLPKATRIIRKDDPVLKREFLIKATKIDISLALFPVLLASVFASSLVNAWLGEGYEQAASLLPWMLAVLLARSSERAAWTVAQGADSMQGPAVANLVDGLANIVVTLFYLTVFDMGLISFPAGSLTTLLVRLFFYQWPTVTRRMGISNLEYFKSSLIPPLVSAFWLWPFFYFIEKNLSNAAGLIMAAFIGGLVYLAWNWWIIADDHDRRAIAQALRPGASL